MRRECEDLVKNGTRIVTVNEDIPNEDTGIRKVSIEEMTTSHNNKEKPSGKMSKGSKRQMKK